MIKRTIGGKTIGFVFDFYSFGITEEVLNMSLDDILSILSPPKKGEKQKPKMKIISALFYGAAVNYCEIEDVAVEFKINNVGQWLNELGLNDSLQIINDALKILEPKNIEPPQTEGEKEQVKNGELVNI